MSTDQLDDMKTGMLILVFFIIFVAISQCSQLSKIEEAIENNQKTNILILEKLDEQEKY